MALLHPSSSDDGLLAVEVEMALKALGIASGDNNRMDGQWRNAVEDLRRSETAEPASRRRLRNVALAPEILAADDDVVVL